MPHDTRSPEQISHDHVAISPKNRQGNIPGQHAIETGIIATLIDDAILAVERDNPNLKGKLPRDYARRGIEPVKLKGLIDLIADIGFKGDRAKARDTLGRVYEYFLGKFAQAEGKLGGEFYTPRCIVRLLVEMLEPYEGRVYDPCCGSGGEERFKALGTDVDSNVTSNYESLTEHLCEQEPMIRCRIRMTQSNS